MMEKWKAKLVNRETVSYFIFGVLTTLVDWISYAFMRGPLGYRVATALSQFLAILFAYVTNKIFVFENLNFHIRYLIREITSFFAAGCLRQSLPMWPWWSWWTASASGRT